MVEDKTVILHGFFLSSAAWRARIALHLKGVVYKQRNYQLRAGEQRSEAYLTLNPQGLVPALEIDGLVLTQSLAICEYLDETRGEVSIIGDTPAGKARARMLADIIACDVHPVQNLKILKKLKAMGHDRTQTDAWACDVIAEGLDAFDAMLAGDDSRYCCGELPTIADIFLIPQMANARRYGVNVNWPKLIKIESNCFDLPAFHETTPDKQPDFQG